MIEPRNNYTVGEVDTVLVVADNIKQSDKGEFCLALPGSENLARLTNRYTNGTAETLWYLIESSMRSQVRERARLADVP